MSTVEQVWRGQFNEVAANLAPYVITAGDGFKWIANDAPPSLYELYRKLAEVGYANGWL